MHTKIFAESTLISYSRIYFICISQAFIFLGIKLHIEFEVVIVLRNIKGFLVLLIRTTSNLSDYSPLHLIFNVKIQGIALVQNDSETIIQSCYFCL